MRIKSDLAELDKVRKFLRHTLKWLHLVEEEYYKIELPVVEMCINIIRYACQDEKGRITLKAWQREGMLYFELRDRGIPFDPSQAGQPDIREIINNQKKGGLGIFLSRRLMDGFYYQREKDQNVLTMYKKIKAAKSRSQ